MQLAASALSPSELAILQASVNERGITGTARYFGLTRHAVAVLVAPTTPKRAGTVALARERIAATRAHNPSPPRPAV